MKFTGLFASLWFWLLFAVCFVLLPLVIFGVIPIKPAKSPCDDLDDFYDHKTCDESNKYQGVIPYP